MKKSEMIEILYEALDLHTGVGSSCCNLELSKENLCKVLDTLVSSGMLPPTTKLNLLGKIDNAWDPE